MRDFSLRRPTRSQEANVKGKASACCARNDGLGGGAEGVRRARTESVPRLRGGLFGIWARLAAGARRIGGAGGVGLGLGGGVSFGVAAWRGVLGGWREARQECR